MTDTGELVSSGNFDVQGDKVEIYFDADHAAPLEFGSPRRNLRARPFLRRALAEKIDAALDWLKRHIAAEL
jgi:hypothetical protein